MAEQRTSRSIGRPGRGASAERLGRVRRAWEAARGVVIGGLFIAALAVAITPDGAKIVSGGDGKTVRAWNLAIGCQIVVWDTDHSGVPDRSTVPTDSSLFVYGDWAGGVHVLRPLGNST